MSNQGNVAMFNLNCKSISIYFSKIHRSIASIVDNILNGLTARVEATRLLIRLYSVRRDFSCT